MFGGLLSGNLTLKDFEHLSYQIPSGKHEDLDEKEFTQMVSKLRSELGRSFPLVTIADLTLSNMHYTVDGDDDAGYKIIIETPGATAQHVYVVKNEGRYKMVAFSPSTRLLPAELGWLALEEIDRGNLVSARKWLDRARDEVHANGGDDPLSGVLFPYFWNKGQDASAADMRTAALVLVPSKELEGPYLGTLNQALLSAKSALDHARIELAVAYAYSAHKQWKEMLPVAEDLTKAFPSSIRAFDLEVTALSGMSRFSEWEKLLGERTAKYPDELAYVRSSAQLSIFQGQFLKARGILKAVIDKGQGTSNDLNSYAWYELLLPGPVDQDDIDTALHANDLVSNNFAILHTLGCIYAQAGRVSQARETLLKAMDSLHLEEPNSELWFGFGLIAEQYGEYDAATTMYQRVDKPDFEDPGSTYTLAQAHLNALHAISNTVANVTKQ